MVLLFSRAISRTTRYCPLPLLSYRTQFQSTLLASRLPRYFTTPWTAESIFLGLEFNLINQPKLSVLWVTQERSSLFNLRSPCFGSKEIYPFFVTPHNNLNNGLKCHKPLSRSHYTNVLHFFCPILNNSPFT